MPFLTPRRCRFPGQPTGRGFPGESDEIREPVRRKAARAVFHSVLSLEEERMNKKWTLLGGLLASVMMMGAAGTAGAADWKPTKPIEIIAPAGPVAAGISWHATCRRR
jgi:hypothetical protein